MVLKSYLLVSETRNTRLPKVDELRPEFVLPHWCKALMQKQSSYPKHCCVYAEEYDIS